MVRTRNLSNIIVSTVSCGTKAIHDNLSNLHGVGKQLVSAIGHLFTVGRAFQFIFKFGIDLCLNLD